MRRLLVIILGLTGFAFSQGSGGKGGGGGASVTTFAGAPTGSCSTTQLAVNTSSSGHFYKCDNASWQDVGPGAAGATAWNSITDQAANKTFSFAHFTTSWTFDATTGSNVNLLTITDTSSNTGTGHLLLVNTASGSAAKPVGFFALGTSNGVEMSATGVLAKVGTGSVNADQCSGAACGTVTSVATTSPITGGPITGTGTIACATCGVTGTGLQQFAGTSSSQLAGVINDETGTTLLVFNTSPLLVTPKFNIWNDANANATITSSATASAVDAITVTNAATANPATVKVSATGSDSNINLELDAKGSGTVNIGAGTTGTVSTGKVTFNGSSSGSASITVPATAGTPADIQLPSATGSSGNCLQTNGASPQVTSWAGCTTTIASGTSAMGTGAISSGTCAAVVTTSATGTATTDAIISTPNTDPTAITGYGPSASGSLYIQAYPTANNVNFKVCNNTSGSITPSALTLNWRVVR